MDLVMLLVQVYAINHAIINVLNLVALHAGIDVVMLVHQLAVMFVQDVIQCVIHLAKPNVKVSMDILV